LNACETHHGCAGGKPAIGFACAQPILHGLRIKEHVAKLRALRVLLVFACCRSMPAFSITAAHLAMPAFMREAI
jgi:hypothetical protein